MKRSWKTSAAGSAAAAGAALLVLGSQDFIRPEHAYWLKLSGGILSGVGPLLIGLFARDNDVTSDDVQALKDFKESKKENPEPPDHT